MGLLNLKTNVKQMKKLKYLLLILLSISYSCDNKAKKTINSNLSNSKMAFAVKSKTVMNNPSKNDIIIALEKAIDFCKTADREEFRIYLNASKEQINSVSDEEFIEIKEDNAYLYKNVIISLKNDESSFKIISNDNNTFKISFIEKGNDSLSVVMNFSYNKDKVLVLDRLNTL